MPADQSKELSEERSSVFWYGLSRLSADDQAYREILLI